MKILLVQAPAGRPEAPIYPLGLAFIAGQLKGHVLRGVDLGMEADHRTALLRELDGFEPDVTAVSLRNIDDSSYPVTHSYVKPFAEVMETLGDRAGTVVVGGTGFSIYPERILQMFPRIDYGIPGEGEEVFPGLLEHIRTGGGLEGWKGGRLLPWRRSDLHCVSPPDYGLFDVSGYEAPDSIGVQSRRGCAYDCAYCTYGYLGGSRFRCRPVEHVMEDVRRIRSMGAGRFQFVDPVFNAPRDYFEELLAALEDSGTDIAWTAWVDESVTPGRLRRMRAAGAVKVDFSPDAITRRGLGELSKRGAPGDLFPAVRAARKEGMQVGVNFFSGNPGEGLRALLAKLFFMLRARLALGWRDTFVNIGTIRVYAHSPLADRMRREKAVDDDFDFFEPVFWRGRGPSDLLYRLYMRLKRLRHG